MVLVQKWPFFLNFFLRNICQKNVVYDILEWKNSFLGYKTRSSKSGKIDIFPNGLTHGCGLKRAIFYILERKSVFQGYKNKQSKKSKDWRFSKVVNPWFWSKRVRFSNFFFRKYRPGKNLLRYSKATKRLSRP